MEDLKNSKDHSADIKKPKQEKPTKKVKLEETVVKEEPAKKVKLEETAVIEEPTMKAKDWGRASNDPRNK